MRESAIEYFILEHVPELMHDGFLNQTPEEQTQNAARLVAIAQFHGVMADDLIDACGGDICQFLMDRQNSYFCVFRKNGTVVSLNRGQWLH
jgi:hypothetical protein